MSRRQSGSTLRVLRAVLRPVALRKVMGAFLLFSAVQTGSWVGALLWTYEVLGPASVGVVALLQLIPPGLFAAAAASFVDRYPAQRVLLAGYIALAATTALTAAAMALAWHPVVVVAAGAAVVCATTMARPAQGGLLPVLARTPEELTAANALVGSVDGLGMLLGPLAAALVFLFGPPALVFAIAAIAMVLASILVLRLPVPAASSNGEVARGHESDPGPGDAGQRPGRSIVTRLRDGARAIVEDHDSRLILALLGAQRVVLGALDVLYVLLAMQVIGTGASGASILSAAMGLGFIGGGLASFRLVGRRELAPFLVGGCLLAGASALVLGGVTSAVLAPLLVAGASLGAATLEVTGRTVLQRIVTGSALTRVLGALEGVELAAWGVGSILAPVLVAVAGVQGAVMIVAVILPATAGLLWTSLRRIDRRVRVPVRELALLNLDPLLSILPAPTLETIASGARWVTLEAGETLIREGDDGDRYFVLDSGALRITQAGDLLREPSEPGYGLGEIALLRDVPRTATAVATAPSVLLAIDRAHFLEAVTGHEQTRQAAEDTAATRVVTTPA